MSQIKIILLNLKGTFNNMTLKTYLEPSNLFVAKIHVGLIINITEVSKDGVITRSTTPTSKIILNRKRQR